MNRDNSNRFATWLVWLVLTFASVGALYVIYELNATAEGYTRVQAEISKPVYGGSVSKIQVPQNQSVINIPTWALFSDNNIWMLASKKSPLPSNYMPDELVQSPVAHGDSSSEMKVSRRIATPLTALVTAAREDGRELVLSSAYRSIEDQQKLMDEFVATKGEQLAKDFVASPGSSEHHTGMSVDFSDASPSCAADSDKCELSFSSIDWLANNAHKYGFILRYPEGAQPITGISFEPWHYRYVGKVLAQNLHNSTITFDEFVELAR